MAPRTSTRVAAALPAALFLLAPALRAQGALLTFPQDLQGAASALGDVTGDGIGDYVVGDPGTGPWGPHQARVYSGADGALLATLLGDNPNDTFGTEVAGLGDVDGDGLGDFAVSAPFAGTRYVRVFSGATFATLYTLTAPRPAQEYGADLAPLGDVDGDGRGDFALSLVIPGGRGEVFVISGAHGKVLRSTQGPTPGGGFGRGLARVPDADGDSLDDLIVGQTDAAFGGGYASVLSSASLAVLWSTGQSDASFGQAVSAAGDLDGDGTGDWLVAAPGEFLALYTTGVIYAYSGAGGALLYSLPAQTNHWRFGLHLSALGDVNGDGRDDFLGGFPSRHLVGNAWGAGDLEIRSGANGTLIYSQTESFGQYEPLGDIDQNGLPDFLVAGRPGWSLLLPRSATQVVLWGRNPTGFLCYQFGQNRPCDGWSATTGGLSASTGQELTIHGTSLQNQSPALVFWGLSFAQVPFRGDNVLCVRGPLVRMPLRSTGGNVGVDDCSGSLSQPFTRTYMRRHGLGPGSTVYSQVWNRRASTGRVLLTHGIYFTLWP